MTHTSYTDKISFENQNVQRKDISILKNQVKVLVVVKEQEKMLSHCITVTSFAVQLHVVFHGNNCHTELHSGKSLTCEYPCVRTN